MSNKPEPEETPESLSEVVEALIELQVVEDARGKRMAVCYALKPSYDLPVGVYRLGLVPSA